MNQGVRAQRKPLFFFALHQAAARSRGSRATARPSAAGRDAPAGSDGLANRRDRLGPGKAPR